MFQDVLEKKSESPFGLLWSKENDQLPEVEGEYDNVTQKWSGLDIYALATYSRSATTGWISDDPDEDKDDHTK